MRRQNRFLLFLSLFLLLAGACSRDDGPVDPGGSGSKPTELVAVLDAGGEFSEPAPLYEETDPEEYDSGDEQYYCTRSTVNLVENFDTYPQFDPNSRIVYPGNLLQGITLGNATPSEIPVARGGGSIVVTLVNGSGTVARTLPEVSIGSVYTAMNEIIAGTPDDLPARTSFTMERISTREQLGVAMRANYNSLTTDIRGSLDYSSDVRYNSFLVKLTQSYYTMAFTTPTDPSQFFGAGVTTEQLSRYVQPGNPAAYVSSVTYGRIFYLLIQSTETAYDMEASIRASFQGATSGGTFDGGVKYVSELNEVKIGGYAIGGDSQLANQALMGDFEALKAFVALGDRITTGQPISYTVNAAADPARQLRVSVATQYDLVDCTPLGESLPGGLAWYRGDRGVQWAPDIFDGSSKRIRVWENLFGDAQRDMPKSNGLANGAGSWWDHWSILYFHVWPNSEGRFPDECFPEVNFQGSMMRDTDYTMFAVLSLGDFDPTTSPELKWLWGDGVDAGRTLEMGFTRPDHRFFVGHGGSTRVAAPLIGPIDFNIIDQTGFHVLTVRFSQTEGMRLYDQGVLIAEDATMTTPIEVFTGAKLGVTGFARNDRAQADASLMFRELQVYPFAATESQRRALETSLMERWGI
ncbi:thiol-activated cytolysin family protein [bacterium]|nr:thiol-activated cytolysin family protein [bacterium]